MTNKVCLALEEILPLMREIIVNKANEIFTEKEIQEKFNFFLVAPLNLMGNMVMQLANEDPDVIAYLGAEATTNLLDWFQSVVEISKRKKEAH